MLAVIFWVVCASEVALFLRLTPRRMPRSFTQKINVPVIGLYVLLFLLWVRSPLFDLTGRQYEDPYFWFWAPAFSFAVCGFPYFLLMGLLRYLVCLAERREIASRKSPSATDKPAKPAPT